MTTYHQQLLYTGDDQGGPVELINGARTAFNLQAAALCGPGQFSNVLADAGCDALLFEPVCVTNLLTEIQSSMNGGVTTGWANDTNATLSASTTQVLQGTHSLRLSSNAAGAMAAVTPTGVSGVRVVAGTYYTATASFRAGSVARNVQTRVRWYDGSGALLSETAPAGLNDSTTAWVTDRSVVLAPAGAITAAVVVRVATPAGAGELHYVDQIGLMPTGLSTAFVPWVLGGGGFTSDVTWQPLTLGGNTNPWDDGSAAADEAMGFYIEEWTGLDGGHHQRATVAVGADRGGARFGPQTARERVMKLNVLLIGTTDRSLAFLFRWLESQLLSCCGACGTRTVFLRDFCEPISPVPTDAELERGWARVERVALVDGPTWEAEPAKDVGCYIRRVSFTLAAGDPCMYAEPTATTTSTSDIAGVGLLALASEAACNTWLSTNRRVSASVAGPTYGAVAPRITITSPLEVDASGNPKSLPDLKIFGVNLASGQCDPCRQARIGELIISPYRAAGMEIEIDMAARTVMYRSLSTGLGWQDGSRFLARQTRPQRRWWSFGSCAGGCVYVEPVHVGLLNSFAGTADPVSSWTVKIEAVPRWGCC